VSAGVIVMQRFGANLLVWVTLALLAALGVLASPLAYATDATDETAPQRARPPAEHKGVIPAPPTGDEGIFTDAPNPEAGHDKEVIPPPDTPSEEPSHSRAAQRLL
jgi:hypothetical protein